MTEQQIDTEALRRLADAATPGPWTVDDGGGYDFSVTQGPDGDYLACDVIQPDAEFIAAARTAIPALLDALEQAERDRDWNLRSSRLAKEGRIKANARADHAEARIKAVRDVLDQARDEFEQPDEADIRRALESVPPPGQ